MSTYEDDHNISARPRAPQEDDRNRNHPTLSNILDSFMNSSTTSTNPPAPGTLPSQQEIEMFTNALRELSSQEGSTLAENLIQSLESHPQQKGISQEYMDSLDRVDVKSLDPEDDCPICTNRFKDDKYPLIVKLPCNAKTKHRGHIFDMECIGPWLKMNSTCPLCRFDLLELQEKRKQRLEEELKQLREEDDEEEDEDWALYG